MTEESRGGGPARAGEGIDEALAREIDAALGDRSVNELLETGETVEAPARGGASEPAMRKGRIVAVSGDDVFVDIGSRTQGVLERAQFEPDKPPVVGGEVEFFVDRYDESEGLFLLTRKGVAQRAAWGSLARGQTVEARVTGTNKGGLECDLSGIRAFMPASQVDMARIPDLGVFVGQKLTAMIVELDRRDNNVVLSRRKLMEQQAAEAREKTMKELAEGQVRTGTVRSIMPYGAFVDLGGVDGLLHVSDMSYSRSRDPAKLVHVGEKVEIKVLKIEEGGNRISLGMKQLQADPWENVAARYAKGKAVKCRVVSLARFGAFVELEPGLEALLPVSEITWKKRVNHPSEILAVGSELEVGVLEIDPVQRRMSVSLKAFEADPWLGVEKRYMINSEVSGVVMRLVDFGAFVEIEPGVEGLIHISELSDKAIRRPGDVVRAGQQVAVRVMGVSEADRRISLSLKAMLPEPEAPAPDAEAAQADDKARGARKRKKPLLRGGLE